MRYLIGQKMPITLNQLQAKRKEKTDNVFLPHLFDKLKLAHKKRYYKTCDCNYCILKRDAINKINGGYYSKSQRNIAITTHKKQLNEIFKD